MSVEVFFTRVQKIFYKLVFFFLNQINYKFINSGTKLQVLHKMQKFPVMINVLFFVIFEFLEKFI